MKLMTLRVANIVCTSLCVITAIIAGRSGYDWHAAVLFVTVFPALFWSWVLMRLGKRTVPAWWDFRVTWDLLFGLAFIAALWLGTGKSWFMVVFVLGIQFSLAKAARKPLQADFLMSSFRRSR